MRPTSIASITMGCALVAGLSLSCAAAQGQGGATIEKVAISMAADGAGDPQPGRPRGRVISKFSELSGVSGRETVVVNWVPPPEGLPAGASVLLEYRRRFSEEPYGLSEQLSFPVRAARISTFQLEDDALEAGPVLMWRIRLVHKGRLLAESASVNWR